MRPSPINKSLFQNGLVQDGKFVKTPSFIKSEAARPFVIGATAGVVLLSLALIITTVALTCIAASSIAQMAALSIAFTAITVSSAVIIAKFVKIIQLYQEKKLQRRLEKNPILIEKTPEEKHSEKIKRHLKEVGLSVSVLSLGLGLTSLGTSVNGQIGKAFLQSGKITTGMGSNSTLMSVCRLIHAHQTQGVHSTELESPEDEEKFKQQIAIANMVIGTVCLLLGITLIVLGGVGIAGVSPALAGLFGTSFLSIGVAQLIKEILKWPFIQEFCANSKDKIKESSFNQFLQKFNKSSQKKESEIKESELQAFLKYHRSTIIASAFFLLAGILLIFFSYLGGLTAYQSIIMGIFGIKALCAPIPMALALSSGGIFHKMKDSLLNKYNIPVVIQQIKEKPSSQKDAEISENINSLNADKEIEKTTTKDSLIQEEKLANLQNRISLIVGSITVLVSIVFILMAIIPGLGGVANAFILIGQSALIIGTILTLVELINFLNRKLNKKNLLET
ncbi:hypothetical protein CLAVI_000012 [Candidatus Clavichlamydia salmonicola]|uniref:hypothetical protein n=1 Tax=Candidatus Clavichlamydia salmonicola TaxID=469812 RepID=UPI001891C79E|nr:hypothetical protein [Candidatus Clavichlamydia salmonicola]MBF5050411.1 hypothetical protein [Candidatus Clavichlamydia salmonicola]